MAGSLQDSLSESLLGEVLSRPDEAWRSVRQFSLDVLSYVNELPPVVLLILSSILTYAILNAVLNLSTNNNNDTPSTPYPMNRYDPIAARRYFDSRPFRVLQRAATVAWWSGTYLSGLGLDYARGNLEENADRRAEELSVLLTRLGPSFIKV